MAAAAAAGAGGAATAAAVSCDRLNGLYACHTGKPINEIEQAMDRDLFMDPQEARDFGIVDSIVSSRKPSPSLS